MIKNENTNKTKGRNKKAIFLTGALAFGTLGTVVLTTSCESPTQDKPIPPKTYYITIWGQTINVTDERTSQSTTTDDAVAKLDAAMTAMAGYYDKAPLSAAKAILLDVVNRGLTISIVDGIDEPTALTSTTGKVGLDYLNTADFSYASDSLTLGANSGIHSITSMIMDIRSMPVAKVLNKNAAQLVIAKPTILAQKGKSLATLDMKKHNNNTLFAMKNAAHVRLS